MPDLPRAPERPTAHAVEPAQEDSDERADLSRLLASGPFPAALRAAIADSGLSLDRIR